MALWSFKLYLVKHLWVYVSGSSDLKDVDEIYHQASADTLCEMVPKTEIYLTSPNLSL